MDTAGLWLGLCASLKLFFLLFIPWLMLRRRWSALGAMAARRRRGSVHRRGGIRAGAYGQWLHSLGQVGWWWLPMNASWHGLVSRIFEGGSSVEPLIQLPPRQWHLSGVPARW